MAALSYVLLPLTGMIAYFAGDGPRARFHGLQAVLWGAAWPLSLYGASAISPGVTRMVFAVGALVWLFLLTATALGRDPALPLIGGLLRRWAEDPPHGRA